LPACHKPNVGSKPLDEKTINMRLYPIHILIKDFSLMVIFISIAKIDWLNNSTAYSGQISWGEVVIISFYFTVSLTIVDLVLQTAIYFGLRTRLKIFKQGNSFIIGVMLHVLTLLLYCISTDLSSFWTANIIAMTLSTIVSGTVYYLLNRRREDKLKAEIG